MFDVGFPEIVVIAVVALIVIGPERLPKVARTLGHMFGRLQRYVNEVKADINREMELDELRKLQSEVQSAARDLEQSVTSAAHEVESGVRSVESQLNEAATAAPPSDAPVPSPPTASTESKPDAPAAARAGGDASHQATLPGFERI
jgi:sec-independent protein translocase protein TatB